MGWFILWIIIIWLLLSGGGWYGYRRSYYGRPHVSGILIVLFIIFLLVVLFAGPHGGYYGSYYGRHP